MKRGIRQFIKFSGYFLLIGFFIQPYLVRANTIYVNLSHPGPVFNGTITNPYNNLQTAINNAQSGDTIKVAQGVYHQNVFFPDSRGLVLQGGFENGNFSNRNVAAYPSTVNGTGNNAVITMDYYGGAGDHQHYEIDGFTIQNGQRGILAINYGNGGDATLIIAGNIIQYNTGLTGSGDFGGGISTQSMVTTIRNNVIRNNTCGKSAGFAVQLHSTTDTFLIENNLIENNDICSDHGAGAGIQAYRGIVRNNVFRNNRILNAWGWGGGLIIDGNQFDGFSNEVYVELSGNVYEYNEAPSGGAGLFIDEGANVRMYNELIAHNTSTSSRNGGLYVDGLRANNNAKTIMENTTIANNTGADWSQGHAITIEGGSEVIARNSIFRNNHSSDNLVDFFVDNSSSLTVEYCIYHTGMSGEGSCTISNSFQDDPLFADTAGNDFHLKSMGGRWDLLNQQWAIDPEHSPAIDAGNPASPFENEPLPNGGRVNLGAYGNTVYASRSYDENQGNIYFVGPNRPYTTLQQVAGMLLPGDVVFVDGGHTYPGGVVFNQPGTEQQKIQIRGIRVNGNRPVISGGFNGVAFTTPWPYTGPEGGHHYIFEGFEVTAAEFRGIYHQAKDLTIRDCYVHDCLAHGILGADQGSGSILLEYTELARCGNDVGQHQIYVATDEINNPGSVFRMQHCYVHSGNGGNNVKTRAERNEIYYNWIEGAYYHELEMIGADSDADGGNPLLAREDGDVVGNVFIKKQTTAGNNPDFFVFRIGGDGTGESGGRYRFLNNTVVGGTSAVFRMYDLLESVEIQNNVFYNPNGIVTLARTVDAQWTTGQEIINGQANWMKTGTLQIPSPLTGTVFGAEPGFADPVNNNLIPHPGSQLVDAGVLPLVSVPGFEFPDPLPEPLKLPPPGEIESLHSASARDTAGVIDIGAYESEAGVPYYSVSPASIDFGTVFTGYSQSAGITITSLGPVPVVIDSIRVNSDAYQLSAMSFPVVIEDSFLFSVVFTPPDAQIYPAIISIYASEVNNSQVNLTGTGIAEPVGGFRVSGEVSGLWQVYDTVFVDGDIIVPLGQTLTITSVGGGTDLFFTGPYKFIVYGKLQLLGNPADSIRIHSADEVTGWRGVQFINLNANGQGNSTVQYCSFRHGKTTGTEGDSLGGAIYIRSSSNLIIEHCHIHNNESKYGGGIYIDYSSPVISNCSITSNTAIYSGGGIFIGYESSPQVSGVALHRNTAQAGNGGGVVIYQGSAPLFLQGEISSNSAQSGGGIACSSDEAVFRGTIISGNVANGTWASGGGILCSANPTISHCIITGNATSGYGGGLACTYQNSPVIDSCEFNGNQAGNGGAVSCFYDSDPVISNSFFHNNSALDGGGGGLYLREGSDPELKDVVFQANNASTNGGALSIENASGRFANAAFIGNGAGDLGGAVYIFQQSSPQFFNILVHSNHASQGGGFFLLDNGDLSLIHNMTLVANSAIVAGAGIAAQSSSPWFYSSIFWNNLSNNQLSNVLLADDTSDPYFNYCMVQGGMAAFTGAGAGGNYLAGRFLNNLDENPLFVDEPNHNYRLPANSPVLNSGVPDPSSLGVPGTDLDGNSRVFNSVIDMGCYEFQDYPLIMNPGNLTIENGETLCMAAISVLTLGGDGTTVLATAGSTSRFEAGSKILIKEGVHVEQNAYAMFRIETESNFCAQQSSLISVSPGLLEELEYLPEISPNRHGTAKIRIYPNPTSGLLNISLDEVFTGKSIVRVYGMRQELLFQQTCSDELTPRIDLGHLAPGMYFLRMVMLDRTETVKIIKR